MLAEERRREICRLLARDGKVRITELTEWLGVSDETVRRDLTVLSEQKELKKVHGGALPLQMATDADYWLRKQEHPEEKRAIGRAAAETLMDGDVIAIGQSSTAEYLAQSIRGVRKLRVVTDSLPIAAILTAKLREGEFEGEVILPGGSVEPGSDSFIGEMTCAALRRFHFDKVFISVTALSEEGVMFSNPAESAVAETMAERGDEVIVLAESRKLGRESCYLCCSYDPVSLVITDGRNPVPPELQACFREHGVEWRIADETH